jgi:hypothetical protein
MPLLKLQAGSVRYCIFCLASLYCFFTVNFCAFAQQKITLREDYRIGDVYQVETTSTQKGELDTVADKQRPNLPKRLAKTGRATSSYAEKILSVDADRLASKTIRRYQVLNAEQTIGNEVIRARLRDGVKHVVLDRQSNQGVTFSPDGPLLIGELEQTRTDVFLPKLAGLYPTQSVQRGDSWKPSAAAIQELTDIQQVTSNTLECTLHSLDADIAVVHFRGQVVGSTSTGSNQQTLQGSYQFDLKQQKMTTLQFEVTSILKNQQQQNAGNITATFQLTRKPTSTDISTTGMTMDPTEENTLLLVQEPRVGLELVHSRRWAPRQVSDKSWQIDGPSGSGITIQFEGANTIPAADTIRKQIEATLSRAVPNLKPLRDPAGWNDVQRLAWTGTQNGKDYVFEYFLWKRGSAGAIIAGRYFAPEEAMAQKDVERMVRSLKMGQ